MESKPFYESVEKSKVQYESIDQDDHEIPSNQMGMLLEKTRTINGLLQRAIGRMVDFVDIARVLAENIGANCMIISRQGRVLGSAMLFHQSCLVHDIEAEGLPLSISRDLLDTWVTRANLHSENCPLQMQSACVHGSMLVTFLPVIVGGQRLGTVILERLYPEFDQADLVLAEHGATVVGLELLHHQTELLEKESRQRTAVALATAALSYSEREAVRHVLNEVEGDEGIVIASKIADEAGITRSVIVNALRKCESAGLIEARSMGMKGTYIRILNRYLPRQMQQLAH